MSALGAQPVPTLRGTLVTLRAPRPSDINARQQYGLNGEYRRMVGADEQHDGPMSHAAARQWYETRCAQPLTWAIEWQTQAIGVAFLHNLDIANRRARYSIGIYAPTAWGHGIGTAATILILGYAFDVLGLHRVDLRVLTYNQRAIRAYLKVGFVQEGIERDSAWIAGRWESDMIMSILEEEYRKRYTS